MSKDEDFRKEVHKRARQFELESWNEDHIINFLKGINTSAKPHELTEMLERLEIIIPLGRYPYDEALEVGLWATEETGGYLYEGDFYKIENDIFFDFEGYGEYLMGKGIMAECFSTMILIYDTSY